MSKINNEIKNINNAIFSALKESAANEVSMWEKQSLKETGEWDDNDDEMALWLDDLRDQAQELANQINGEVKSVTGFDAYQGPRAVVHSPKHGDVIMWYDQEDDTGRSFNVKVAHVGWITGGINNLADLLNQDTIPENEILSEGSMEDELGKEADEWLEDQYRKLEKKYGPDKAHEMIYGKSDSSKDKNSFKEGVLVVNDDKDIDNTVILLKDVKAPNGLNVVYYKDVYFVVDEKDLKELEKNNMSVLHQRVRARSLESLFNELNESFINKRKKLKEWKDGGSTNQYTITFYVNSNLSEEELEARTQEVVSALEDDEMIERPIKEIKVKKTSEIHRRLPESSLKEERVNMVVHKGDVFENQNGIKCTIVDVDNEHTIEGEPQVMFRFTSNSSNTQGETTKTVPMKNVVHMLNQNGYKKVY